VRRFLECFWAFELSERKKFHQGKHRRLGGRKKSLLLKGDSDREESRGGNEGLGALWTVRVAGEGGKLIVKRGKSSGEGKKGRGSRRALSKKSHWEGKGCEKKSEAGGV